MTSLLITDLDNTLHDWVTFFAKSFTAMVDALVGFIHVLPRSRRKPNPELLLEICAREGVSHEDTWYVGDSLSRDIGMAKAAGVTAVWARYGAAYDPELWKTLVRVSHWTEEDIEREADLKKRQATVQPDFTIDAFDELIQILGIEHEPVAMAHVS